MSPGVVERLTSASARLAPLERGALTALVAAWVVGTALEASGIDRALAARVAARLDPPLPSAEALAAALPPGDPRVELYAAGLALRAELARAGAPPEPIDPNLADRADWDRLPGVGPKTAVGIVEYRARHGPFRRPEDLLGVRGIGPVRLERLRPWLEWPADASGSAGGVGPAPGPPDLNRVEADFLARLPNIGPHLARRIVDERLARRGFRDWSDVLAVKGVGPARLRVLQNATRLGTASPGAAATIAEGEEKS